MKDTADILLVEDNEGDIELTQIAFEDARVPCRLHVAHNGMEALDYLSKRGLFHDAVTPDLILLDINMPRMDGLEFLGIIKHEDEWKAIPVIMLTSSDAASDVLKCYRLQANSYILKPTGLEKFADVARQIGKFWIHLAQLPHAPSGG